MEKIETNIVLDYLTGKEITKYDIEELENNFEFMKKVIVRDKKSYYLLSDELKENYDMVKLILEKYSDDKKFCDKVATRFLSKCNDTAYNFEINIIMGNILEGDYDDQIRYTFPANTCYASFIMTIEQIKKNADEETKEEIGLGFGMLEYEFKNNEQVLGYISKKMLDEIFVAFMYFELSLHKIYLTKKNLDEVGKYEVLFNYIARYDKSLCEYLSTHPYLLTKILKEYEKIRSNWDKYEKQMVIEENKKYRYAIQEVEDYLEEDMSTLDPKYAIELVAKQLGIYYKMKKYMDEYYDEYNIFLQLENKIQNGIVIDIEKCKNIKEIRNILIENLSDEYNLMRLKKQKPKK